MKRENRSWDGGTGLPFPIVTINLTTNRSWGIVHLSPDNGLNVVHELYSQLLIKDLRPVCQNCHAVIHSRKPAFSIEEVRKMLY
jgi:hypothetical protein